VCVAGGAFGAAETFAGESLPQQIQLDQQQEELLAVVVELASVAAGDGRGGLLIDSAAGGGGVLDDTGTDTTAGRITGRRMPGATGGTDAEEGLTTCAPSGGEVDATATGQSRDESMCACGCCGCDCDCVCCA